MAKLNNCQFFFHKQSCSDEAIFIAYKKSLAVPCYCSVFFSHAGLHFGLDRAVQDSEAILDPSYK